MAETFGATLRRLRKRAGLSQPALARRVFVNQSTISRLETGRLAPDARLAVRVDAVLDADGALIALTRPAAGLLTPDDADRLDYIAAHARRLDLPAVESLGVVLGGLRRLEDTVGASMMIEPVRAQLALVACLVQESRGGLRPHAVRVGAQWAQFAGWLSTATGHYPKADRWFSRAYELATEAVDRDMVATALSFKGHLAWLTGQVNATIGLSQAVQRQTGVYAGQLAYDALQEARGHAVLGDKDVVDRKVDEANDLALLAVEQLPDAPPWHYYRHDAFWLLEEGRVYRYLGRPVRAAELLTAGLDTLPAEQQAAEWADSYRRDLASLVPVA
ncbi:helix-turn-helix transcriptional regulator [Actinocrispum wychmicini]|uniref:DNA-binding XRE family transcriptional regulator n=1 Tax=Actinocrispum wychmicini TaxID=1213861 RepID=A0A4R2JCK9_9PSEU|nr:helix-turn-helix transcriptional regulator [Actinocrispum wychmicini]TCO57303.1 DNA-binding XRE family transcriptional regulator [Actinocrispum wychmicini]